MIGVHPRPKQIDREPKGFLSGPFHVLPTQMMGTERRHELSAQMLPEKPCGKLLCSLLNPALMSHLLQSLLQLAPEVRDSHIQSKCSLLLRQCKHISFLALCSQPHQSLLQWEFSSHSCGCPAFDYAVPTRGNWPTSSHQQLIMVGALGSDQLLIPKQHPPLPLNIFL